MKIMLKKLLSGLIIFVICTFILIKFFVLDNPKTLCILAEGFDEPSTPFYFVIERIYKLSEKKNISDKLINKLANGDNLYLHDIYIRLLGVLGKKESLYELEKIYIKYQKDKNYRARLYYVIKSMGLIGNEEIVPLLETINLKYNELQVQVSGANIAAALYLITGSSGYYYDDILNERQKLYLTEELIKAREVIVASKDRKRTFNEMVILDKTFRPPDEKWQK